jgi:hypothetical protein
VSAWVQEQLELSLEPELLLVPWQELSPEPELGPELSEAHPQSSET